MKIRSVESRSAVLIWERQAPESIPLLEALLRRLPLKETDFFKEKLRRLISIISQTADFYQKVPPKILPT